MKYFGSISGKSSAASFAEIISSCIPRYRPRATAMRRKSIRVSSLASIRPPGRWIEQSWPDSRWIVSYSWIVYCWRRATLGSPLRVCIPPAACHVEPAVSSRRSSRIASVQPAFARWYRTLAPTTPPPMTTTWADDFNAISSGGRSRAAKPTVRAVASAAGSCHHGDPNGRSRDVARPRSVLLGFARRLRHGRRVEPRGTLRSCRGAAPRMDVRDALVARAAGRARWQRWHRRRAPAAPRSGRRRGDHGLRKVRAARLARRPGLEGLVGPEPAIPHADLRPHPPPAPADRDGRWDDVPLPRRLARRRAGHGTRGGRRP